jgi:hypothetical protein
MNQKSTTIDENQLLLKYPNFPKNCGFTMHSLLSMNENIQLLISDISSNTNIFNCVYYLIKESHLSSLNDLFNGMANPKFIVNPPLL